MTGFTEQEIQCFAMLEKNRVPNVTFDYAYYEMVKHYVVMHIQSKKMIKVYKDFLEDLIEREDFEAAKGVKEAIEIKENAIYNKS